MADVTIMVKLTFHQVSGETLRPGDSVSIEDFVIDAFASETGKRNGARKPLRIAVTDNDDHEASYELDLVDDV